jgi:hypothetical protein
MLNGMGRTLEKQLRENGENHGANPRGFPEPLNPEP